MPPGVYTQVLHTTQHRFNLNQLSGYKYYQTLTRSLCTIDECFTNIAVCEHARGTDIVPIFTSERVDTENKKYNTFKNGRRQTLQDMLVYTHMYGMVTFIEKP